MAYTIPDRLAKKIGESADITKTPRMAIARMGDGYFQVRTAGINPIDQNYTIIFPAIHAEDRDELDTLLSNSIGDFLKYDPLDPVGGANQKNWLVDNWRFRPSTEGLYWWRLEINLQLVPGGGA